MQKTAVREVLKSHEHTYDKGAGKEAVGISRDTIAIAIIS
jgi:hypothetical protein